MFQLADQVMDFWKDALGLIAKNIIYIIVLLIPFIMTFVLRNKISFQKKNRKNVLITLLIIILLIASFKLSLLIKKDKTYSSYEIYYKIYERVPYGIDHESHISDFGIAEEAARGKRSR